MKLSKKEIIFIILKCLLLISIISYLFYNSWIAFFAGCPFLYFLYKGEKKKELKKKHELMEERFKDVLESVLAALKAGYSVENAFIEAEQDMKYRFGEKDAMVFELVRINRQVKNNIPIENLIVDFAIRTESDNIKDFAGVFKIARKSGGDMGKILERTITIIKKRMELKQEIALLVASKKYEQTIMNYVPIGIIIYIRMTNPGYFDCLYHNLLGVFIMTCALGLYYFAYCLSEKILDIA